MIVPLSDKRLSAGNQIPDKIGLVIRKSGGRCQTMKLAVDQIEVTAGTQVRVKIDPKIVDEYAEAIEAGAIFPALTVFAPKNAQRYILADGFHRLAACKKVGRKTIGVEIKEGGVHEALHYALSTNAEHGLRRSHEDKHNAVELALKDPHYDDWSLREIGELCRVSKDLVRKVKEEHNQKAARKPVFKDSNGTVEPRPRKPSPTQDQLDRTKLMDALATIKSFPFDGAEGYGRLQLLSNIDDLNYCIDWLTEALQEHVAGAYSESVNTQEESAEE